MVGKHSKSFLESIKEISFNTNSIVKVEKQPLSWPFKIIIGVLVLSMVLSTVWVAVFFVPQKTNQAALKKATEIFTSNDSETALKALAGENKDIKGWLKIHGTNINYPICQAKNNTFYMSHNHLGKKSRFGALFLSSEDNFGKKDNDRNSVIFGNNMKDGSMFGSLKKYRDINFYKKYPIINLYYGKEAEEYAVFSVMLLSSSKNDGGEAFNASKSYFNNESEFNEWYAEAAKRSLIKTNIEVELDDEILTLVTVADDFEGARLVVMAKRIETVELSHIDTNNASVNPNIKYPKIWYSTRGLKYPY